jgi:N-acetylglucosaminyl-diphospho-decaprenol L-rhamnosyltransferase
MSAPASGATPPITERPTPIAVAVVSFNTRDHLIKCLASVAAEGPQEVVVVDNGSADGSAEAARSTYPGVVVVANASNRGYGSAANQAIEAVESPYVLLLNADTRLRHGALAALTAYLDSRPRAAIVGPRLIDERGRPQPSCFAFPDPLQTFFQTTVAGSLVRRLPRVRDSYRLPSSPPEAGPVPWVMGAALALRRQSMAAVGGFDERFFMYSEEVDLCYRFAKAGWEVHFTPAAVVVHVGGASARQQPAELEAERYLATRRFYAKHYSTSAQRLLTVLTVYRMLHNLARDLLLLAAGRRPDRREVLRRRVSVWRRVLRLFWAG